MSVSEILILIEITKLQLQLQIVVLKNIKKLRVFCLFLEEKTIVRGNVVKFAAKKFFFLQKSVVLILFTYLGQWVLRGRCSMKIEARFEVGLERPAPSNTLTPARYLSKLSERSGSQNFLN